MNIAASKTDTDFLLNAEVDELKKIAEDHPYFSPAHFFLTKRMKYEKSAEFLTQLQKTAVYFSNPFWLHYQLLHEINFREENKEEPVEAAAVDQHINLPHLAEDETKIEAEEKKPENSKYKNNDDDENTLVNDIHKVLQRELNKPPEINEVPSKLSEVLEAQFKEFKKPLDENAELPVEIKSYHTIDYFASQGIKLDVHSQDKLGKQVLRFTDWLKQMKRINSQPADLGTEVALENKVIDNAAHSNELEEISTEAMAKVLEKQGKVKQAIELYEKLSLLHPDKSFYFAAQIKILKGQ